MASQNKTTDSLTSTYGLISQVIRQTVKMLSDSLREHSDPKIKEWARTQPTYLIDNCVQGAVAYDMSKRNLRILRYDAVDMSLSAENGGNIEAYVRLYVENQSVCGRIADLEARCIIEMAETYFDNLMSGVSSMYDTDRGPGLPISGIDYESQSSVTATLFEMIFSPHREGSIRTKDRFGLTALTIIPGLTDEMDRTVSMHTDMAIGYINIRGMSCAVFEEVVMDAYKFYVMIRDLTNKIGLMTGTIEAVSCYLALARVNMLHTTKAVISGRPTSMASCVFLYNMLTPPAIRSPEEIARAELEQLRVKLAETQKQTMELESRIIKLVNENGLK